MKKKLTAIAVAIGIIGSSVLTAGVALGDEDYVKKVKDLRTEFESRKQKLSEMPNQTPEEIEATVTAGKELKKFGKEIAKEARKADPDGEEKFANQLRTSIFALTDSIVELKSRGELKKAEAAERQLAKFEEGQKAYQNKEKTVKQLRKELDIPVD
ncbi:hypothetical protein [Paenibacillus hexagrammi]|uniref:Gas vesicle protein n=1 Tax=Paenibacillus hexagrammi TaxID=2908839 RepID=A0ABY3SSN7_9BACL|nr:hypothetical protein [Paenibacillus sp. YPD9-1]UJF36130.1 hypothetical protein L0M14_14325 [Paenibacillus sp. YPD9-1]